jgi:hypothetical protein
MKESILHYIWQNKLFDATRLFSDDNEKIEVIDTGKPNSDAGPDFFNAKVRIGDTLWAGNVEIHTRSSDWFRHGHQADKAYDNVILHVVKYSEGVVTRSDGKPVSQVKLIYPDKIEKKYNELISNEKWLPCSDRIGEIPSVFIDSWVNSLLAERLEQKMNTILGYLKQTENHWEEAFYITLARSFGFGINSPAFEMLARSLPANILAKHKNNLFQLEALLFGQAGLLDARDDDYAEKLADEYAFLKKKYDLQGMDASMWKLLRLHPGNFPHVRLAQFAALVHQSSKLFSKIIENPEIGFLTEIFSSEPSQYWIRHYRFGIVSPEKKKRTGKQSVESIMINAVVPFVFCYAVQRGNQELKEKALQLLEKIPAEKNSIIKQWKAEGMKIINASDSQAFLQLKKYYCDDKKCLRCRIGHKVLTI